MSKYIVNLSPRNIDGTYGSKIDITERVKSKSIGTIKRSIDSSDFSIGLQTFSNLKLTLINHDGKFNDELSSGPIFLEGRDLAKIEIIFMKDTSTISFEGLINEEGTKQDFDTITFDVLSKDSIFRKVKVAVSTITNGMLCSTAIKTMLNNVIIKSVLTYSGSNINVDYDFPIDDASKINNATFTSILKNLLEASNSVLYINKDGDIIVSGRTETKTGDPFYCYGQFSLEGSSNITKMLSFNNGKHRVFNSVKVNETEKSQNGHVLDYGYYLKTFSFPFITNPATEADIANRVSSEFKTAKFELKMEVPSSYTRDIDLLNLVSVDYPKHITREKGKFFPIAGDAIADDPLTPCPREHGSISIPPQMIFKIIEINERPSSFKTVLKLRQAGKELSDGFFDPTFSSIAGIATADLSPAVLETDLCEQWNPSVAGAAQPNCTKAV